MWLKQCHKPSPSHHHFYRWALFSPHQSSFHRYFHRYSIDIYSCWSVLPTSPQWSRHFNLYCIILIIIPWSNHLYPMISHDIPWKKRSISPWNPTLDVPRCIPWDPRHVRPLPWERRSLQLFSPRPRLALPVAGNGKKHEKTGNSFDLTWKVVDLARKNVDLTRRSCGLNRI